MLDIIFKNGKPIEAVPGGSTFNGIVSLGRAGVKTCSSARRAMTEWRIRP